MYLKSNRKLNYKLIDDFEITENAENNVFFVDIK